ncbi:MAG: ribonuclease E inhibitor RraB [Propionibacteriales bacterium]|nr:ribonuclease E inhibitor RraB [Propionibacteriales bacterium]
MGLFNRKKKTEDLPSSGHEMDDQVLQQLGQVGADLGQPRLWEHFVYCDDETGARQLAQQAAAAGWTVQPVAEGFGVVASRTELVNPQTVAAARAFFESLAVSVPGGDYDGWGAEAG